MKSKVILFKSFAQLFRTKSQISNVHNKYAD